MFLESKVVIRIYSKKKPFWYQFIYFLSAFYVKIMEKSANDVYLSVRGKKGLVHGLQVSKKFIMAVG